MSDEIKNPAAVELGKRGGKKTAERGAEYYAEIQAKRQTRAGGRPKNPSKAAFEGKLMIGGLEIECAVLEDGTRLISQRALTKALGAPSGGAAFKRRSEEGVADLPIFLAYERIKPFISGDLSASLKSSDEYIPLHGGRSAFGIKAELIPEICDVWLKGRDAGVLTGRQMVIAQQADILMRGLAHVGIVALVDEATGYQYVRARNALEEILEKFISTEFRKWAKMFPDDFYREMFRLRSWEFKEDTVKRTPLVGKLTLDLVYDRLAPGVRQRLEQVNPKNEKGYRKYKLFQRLTEDVGDPSLRAHLTAVIALMKSVDDWDSFTKAINRALPRYIPMPLFEQEELRALPEGIA